MPLLHSTLPPDPPLQSPTTPARTPNPSNGTPNTPKTGTAHFHCAFIITSYNGDRMIFFFFFVQFNLGTTACAEIETLYLLISLVLFCPSNPNSPNVVILAACHHTLFSCSTRRSLLQHTECYSSHESEQQYAVVSVLPLHSAPGTRDASALARGSRGHGHSS